MRAFAHSSDRFSEHVERLKRDYPSYDEKLRRYRERRREYESRREGAPKTRGYPAQRGVRRDYRV